MSDTVYWLWLQKAIGAGARTDEILSAFPTARAVYESGAMEWRISGVFTPKQVDKLEKAKLSEAETIFAKANSLGQEVLTPDREEYPTALRTLRDLPLALFVQGDLSVLEDTLAIAVVGSRHPSMYSLDVARKISRDLAHAGAVVVSGGAMGIDSAAHDGALSAKGRTVGVLGCGLDSKYLMSQATLREEISRNGALISEYAPGSPAVAAHFPLRNRLISGLSSGVLVIEANEKSGSLITARFAAEQGKDVFGVPGDLTSMDYTGVNRLIRDGAKPVFSAQDVLSEYMWVYEDTDPGMLGQNAPAKAQTKAPKQENSIPEKSEETKTPPVKRALDDSLSDTAKRIYDLFGDIPLYTDDLVRASGFEPNRVFTALTELEICGFIKMIEGKRYTIAE